MLDTTPILATQAEIATLRFGLRRFVALNSQLGKEWIRAKLLEPEGQRWLTNRLIEKGLNDVPHDLITAIEELPRVHREIRLGQFEQ